MYDVAQAFGVDGVLQHRHSSDDRRPESLAGQRRLARKWARERESLHARTQLDPEIIDTRQLELISRLIDNAFATVPFYYELYRAAGYRSGDIVSWEDYHSLPILTKDVILSNFEGFVASRALPSSLCYSSRTSGSSGRTLTILQDDAASDLGALFYLRHYEQLLGRQRRPDEWLYEVYLAPPRYSSLDGAFPTFSLSQDCPPELAAEHLARLKPTVLAGFPSYFLRLIEAAPDLRRAGVDAICTNSEASTPRERERISDAFGASCFDEYSSEELYLIATQCRHGLYHVVEDNVRVDVIDADETQLGDIIATSIVNQYMPFIRYRQGDVVRLGRVGCACGNRFRSLDALMGRADQFLRGPKHKAVAPDRVMALYDRTLIPASARVSEFSIFQSELGRVSVFIVPEGESASADSLGAFVSGLQAIFEDPQLKVDIHTVREMPRRVSHKRRLITCTVVPPADRTGE